MFRSYMVFILLLIPSVSFSQTCSSLFRSEVPSISNRVSLKTALEKILLNPDTIRKIDETRRKYDHLSAETRMGATVQILHALLDLRDLTNGKDINPSEEKILELGLDNLLQDLTQISPRFISTERIMNENIAVIAAMKAREDIKELPKNKFDNVVVLSGGQFKNNSAYIEARRVTFDLIDSYYAQNYIPKDILSERVDELLLADLRYQMLAVEEKFELAERIVNSLVNAEHEGVETILEKFFAKQERVRLK